MRADPPHVPVEFSLVRKGVKFLFLLLPLVTIMGTCSEEGGEGNGEPDPSSLLGKSWELLHFEKEGEKRRPEHSYILKVLDDDRFSLQLKVNRCHGQYHIEEDQVEFKNTSCTEACCDPELAREFSRELVGSFSWSKEKGKLKLERDALAFLFKEGESKEGVKE